MLFEKVWTWVKAHPLYAILIAVAVVFLLFAAFNGIGKGIEAYKANRFDKKQEAYEREIVGLKAQRDAAIQRGADAEAKALLKESENNELKDLIATKGGAIVNQAKEMEAKIEQAKRDAGKCGALPVTEQRDCLCAELRGAGFDCK